MLGGARGAPPSSHAGDGTWLVDAAALGLRLRIGGVERAQTLVVSWRRWTFSTALRSILTSRTSRREVEMERWRLRVGSYSGRNFGWASQPQSSRSAFPVRSRPPYANVSALGGYPASLPERSRTSLSVRASASSLLSSRSKSDRRPRRILRELAEHGRSASPRFGSRHGARVSITASRLGPAGFCNSSPRARASSPGQDPGTGFGGGLSRRQAGCWHQPPAQQSGRAGVRPAASAGSAGGTPLGAPEALFCARGRRVRSCDGFALRRRSHRDGRPSRHATSSRSFPPHRNPGTVASAAGLAG